MPQGPPPMRPGEWNRPPMQQGFPPQGPPQMPPVMGPRGPPPIGPPGGPPQGPPQGPAPHVNPAFFQQGGGPPPPIQHMPGPGPGILILFISWMLSSSSRNTVKKFLEIGSTQVNELLMTFSPFDTG